MPEAPARLPPGVKGLSAVSLFNDFASEMVYPVLPAFITGPLGGSAVQLGALDGAADLVSALLKWVSGRLADRPGWSRPLILAGYGTAMLIRPVIAVASSAWQVVGFRVVDRVGKGLRTPARDAMLVEMTPEPLRGRAFGFHRGADHLGAVLGSLTAWWLLQRQAGVRDVISWSALPGLVALLVLLFVLRRFGPSALPHSRTSGLPHSRTSALPHARTSAPLRLLVLALLAAARLPETLLLLRLQDLGVAVALVPLAWAGLHLVRSASSYPGGWLSDRLGPCGSLAAGSLFYAVAVMLLAFPLSPGWALGIFLAHGLVAGLVEPAERVAAARLAPGRAGAGFGRYHGTVGLLALPAGLGFGWLYVTLGGATALLGSAALLVLLAPLWLRVGPA